MLGQLKFIVNIIVLDINNLLKKNEGKTAFLEKIEKTPKHKKTNKINPPKNKYSVFKISINTLKDYSKLSNTDISKFQKLVDYIFSKNIKKYLVGEGPIKDIKFNNKYEIGDAQHRFHVHGTVQITHLGMYKLDIAKIREVINKWMGYKLNLSIHASGNPVKEWEDYVNKNDVNHDPVTS